MKLILSDRLRNCRPTFRRAFTLSELLVLVAVVCLLAVIFLPILARNQTDSSALRCLNNHRQLIQSWQMYASENNDGLVAAQGIAGRPIWMTGNVSFQGGITSAHWDTNANIVVSPLWPYTAKRAEIFRCPADRSTVLFGGARRPRVRSISMSQVFGTGEWLSGFAGPGPYRVYSNLAQIRRPNSTFVFTDEHPDGINDGAFANQIAGAEPTSPPGGERIIDFPANFHSGGGTFSFADGRAEIHRWIGRTIQPPLSYSSQIFLNIPAGDSGVDVRWLAANTTVRQ